VSDRREFRDLASPADLEATIADLDLGGGTETVSVAAARGRVLAERVDADIDVPGFDRAAMDGYAVRAEDTVGASESTPVTLDLAGAVHPGEEPEAVVDPGTAVETSTGAVLPPGADAVVVVEETSETASGVDIRTAVAPGDAVMAAGTDVAAGERALGPGRRLTPREIGLLSAIGVETVSVRAPPTVGIVSTGDELVRPGEPLANAAGQIHDVNSYAIATAVEEAGGDPVVYPHVGDDEAAREAGLVEAADACDHVLSSGSTSASAIDVVYRVVERRGELLLHGVAVKPGKPTLVGRLGGAAYVGLPGYPVSALTIFRAFLASAIRTAAGRPEPPSARLPAEMAVRERFGEGRRRLAPVGLVGDGDGSLLAYPVDKGSGATTTLVDADGVVEVPAETDYLSPGEAVDVDLFSTDVRPPRVLVVGEADPALSRLLDGVDRPRFLPRGSRGGARSLRDGIADVAVLAGPVDPDDEVATLAAWRREWGLVVPAGNPAEVEGLGDLVERDLQLANRDGQSGLRLRFDAALAEFGAVDEHTPAVAIAGYDLETRGVDSPARRVAAGSADAGLGLAATAARLDLGFVPLGTDVVWLVADPSRRAKPGVEQLADCAGSMADVTAELAGYHVP
jgi:molybdenum cofactor synthesis domain-containing protein